jgi:hypothetical protein
MTRPNSGRGSYRGRGGGRSPNRRGRARVSVEPIGEDAEEENSESIENSDSSAMMTPTGSPSRHSTDMEVESTASHPLLSGASDVTSQGMGGREVDEALTVAAERVGTNSPSSPRRVQFAAPPRIVRGPIDALVEATAVTSPPVRAYFDETPVARALPSNRQGRAQSILAMRRANPVVTTLGQTTPQSDGWDHNDADIEAGEDPSVASVTAVPVATGNAFATAVHAPTNNDLLLRRFMFRYDLKFDLDKAESNVEALDNLRDAIKEFWMKVKAIDRKLVVYP